MRAIHAERLEQRRKSERFINWLALLLTAWFVGIGAGVAAHAQDGKGAWVADAPYRAFGPAVTANQGTPQYGPLANTREMSAFLVAVSNTTGSVVVADQNGAQFTFGTNGLVLGQVYQLSVSQFVTVTGSGATLVPLYR